MIAWCRAIIDDDPAAILQQVKVFEASERLLDAAIAQQHAGELFVTAGHVADAVDALGASSEAFELVGASHPAARAGSSPIVSVDYPPPTASSIDRMGRGDEHPNWKSSNTPSTGCPTQTSGDGCSSPAARWKPTCRTSTRSSPSTPASLVNAYRRRDAIVE